MPLTGIILTVIGLSKPATEVNRYVMHQSSDLSPVLELLQIKPGHGYLLCAYSPYTK